MINENKIVNSPSIQTSKANNFELTTQTLILEIENFYKSEFTESESTERLKKILKSIRNK